MSQLRPAACILTGLLTGLLCSLIAADAHAYGIADCTLPQPPSIGVAVGRSSPYMSLVRGAVESLANASVDVSAGSMIAGRTDLPVLGPVRLRVEGSLGRWNVRQKLYDPAEGYRLVESTSAGYVSARHVVGLIGVRTGRAPLCAHVSAGPGLYAIGFRETSARQLGVALAAGVEGAIGEHGALQADVALHLIVTGRGHPITSSTAVPAASLSVGCAYRF